MSKQVHTTKFTGPNRPPAWKSRWRHRLFVLGVVLKGLDGVVELIAGATFICLSGATIQSLTSRVTAAELAEDPTDRIANYLLWLSHHLSAGTRLFAAIYLIAHGVVKILLAASLIRERGWAFPIALLGLGALIVYQSVRAVENPSLALIVLTVVDAGVFSLIAMEWRWRTASDRGRFGLDSPGHRARDGE